MARVEAGQQRAGLGWHGSGLVVVSSERFDRGQGLEQVEDGKLNVRAIVPAHDVGTQTALRLGFPGV